MGPSFDSMDVGGPTTFGRGVSFDIEMCGPHVGRGAFLMLQFGGCSGVGCLGEGTLPLQLPRNEDFHSKMGSQLPISTKFR